MLVLLGADAVERAFGISVALDELDVVAAVIFVASCASSSKASLASRSVSRVYSVVSPSTNKKTGSARRRMMDDVRMCWLVF